MSEKSVDISDVKIPSGWKVRGDLKPLVESIHEVGLLNPIIINADGKLVAGRRRLEACKVLGWKQIPARTFKLSEAQSEIATIDENLARDEISKLERAKLTARRKELYLQLHPETKQGGAPPKKGKGKGGKAKSKTVKRDAFTSDTAKKTGKSRRSVERSARIGEKIAPMAAEILQDTEVAESAAQLSALVALPQAEQVEVAKAIAKGEAKSVPEAIAARAADEDAPKDELGVEIPKHLRGVFELREDFSEMARVLAGVTRKVKQLSDLKELRGALSKEAIIPKIEQAWTLILDAKPHAVCPKCGGDKSECDACRSLGWVNRAAAELKKAS